MRLIPVSRAGGMTVARDLPPTGPGRIPLLRRGAVLTPRMLEALTELGIGALWVQDELSDGIVPVDLLPEPVRAETAAKVAGALDEARDALGASQPLGHDRLTELQAVVERIAASIADSADAALFLGDMAAADQYTHHHSVNVTALGLLLARAHWRREGWIDYRGQRRWDRMEERLVKLGMGLLLHDIGKMAVPAEVLDKPGKLDAGEWELIKAHPDAGCALLQSATVSPLVRTVVRDHHERWNGSGYPRGLEALAIGEFARLAAVADVYDAVTSRRPYADAQPPHVGVGVICEGAGSAFDPGIVKTFRRVVMPHPVGTEVTLPDGRTGVVADVDPERPYEPLVRFEDGEQHVALEQPERTAAAS